MSRNGHRWVINWVKRLLSGIHPLNDKEWIQQYLCNNCGKTFPSQEAYTLKKLRKAVKLFVNKFICLLRFKEGLSLRSIRRIVRFVFGINSSIGYISQFTNRVGARAQEKLQNLSSCRQKKVLLAMLDETFPKIINGTANLGLLIYEYGLIRAVKTVKRNHWYIKKLIEKSMGVFFNPSYLLGDYNPSYPKAIASLNLGIILLKDFVHTIRHIYRLLAQSLREVKVNAPKLSFKERKELKRHKKKEST